MKKKLLWQMTAGLLALLLLGGCGGKTTAAVSKTPAAETAVPAMAAAEPPTAGTPEPEPAFDPAVAEVITRSDGIHADTDYADMAWYLYDMTDFNAQADRLAETGDAAEAEEIYQWLLTEYARLKTLDELAWIDFYVHGTDADAEACQATDEMLTNAADAMFAAVSSALAGGAAGEFSAYVGEDVAAALTDYEEMTDREVELQNRETELQLEYNNLLSRDDLSEPELNYKAGTVYLELVAIRNELAELYGYDSFADYAYENYYGRDFTPADARTLCEQIKPYARRYYADCCYCGAFYVDLGPVAERTAEELIALLRQYAPEISGGAAEAQRYMEQHGLYLLGSADDIAELGFTTTLDLYNAPFLYNSLYGSIYDIQSTFHEFGHYYDAYINQPKNVLTDVGSYDIFEIHSTGLEALSCAWYDEIFGDAAEEALIYCLDGLMYNVVSGCMYDEFQQYVYTHPDMTVDEVNAAFVRIMESYGRELWSQADAYQWMYVSHNFESPFYYVSYAVSALASLQLWTRSQTDRDAALTLYNDLVGRGAYDVTYCELLRDVGLAVFTDDLDGCIAEPYAALEEMCLRYDGALPAAA